MTDGDKIGWVGEKRTFTCVGQGLPLPTISWERGSQYISRNNIYDVSEKRESDKVISTLEVGSNIIRLYTSGFVAHRNISNRLLIIHGMIMLYINILLK